MSKTTPDQSKSQLSPEAVARRRQQKKKQSGGFRILVPERYGEINKRHEKHHVSLDDDSRAEAENEQAKLERRKAEIEQEIIEKKKQEKQDLDKMRAEAEADAQEIVRVAEEQAFQKIKDAEEEHRQVVERTKTETEQMVAAAEQKSSDIEMEIERRREEIYEQQKQRGYKEGWDEGYREGEQELKKINERLESIIRAVTEKRVEIIESSERQLVEIVRLVSRKVVKKIIEDHDDIIIYNIKEALSRIRDKSHLTIKVNFNDLRLAMEKKQEIIGMIENLQKVEIIEDSLIEPGGCVIITDFGEIDARISNQLARIEDRVLDMEYKP